ncbi:hypothetical protein MTO96_008623 [Rhipicephalus appendiculatus]
MFFLKYPNIYLEWGLPLVVAAKHMVPLWVAGMAGTAGFLAVVLAHSPLSPLPVPPLPHAPVGRFPPKQTVLKVGLRREHRLSFFTATAELNMFTFQASRA